MDTKKPSARPCKREQQVMLLALYRVPMLQAEIVNCLRRLSKRSEQAINERVFMILKQIQKLPAP